MHYLIIIIIIGIIIFLQTKSYRSTSKKSAVFRGIFPCSYEDYILKNEYIFSKYDNPVFETILYSINNYLSKNKSVISDFHLLKDIIDRNCDAKEEEINTQIPVPLYLGLTGTMIGILVGIGYLVFSGDLEALLGASATPSSGAEGIKALMGGVALAMISSIWGIMLTTYNSSKNKEAKTELEANKNLFISWLQVELLPVLSNDISGALAKMTQNLASFNATFTGNISELRDMLDTINYAYHNMSTVLNVIDNLKIEGIATANIAVYEKLKNCTKEIGQFATYLQSVNEYIANVRALNEKLDDARERSKAIEGMGEFFRIEIQQIEQRKAYISKAVGTIDAALQDAISKLRENTELQFNELTKATVKQQQALQQKLEETVVIVSELKNLTAVKEIMSDLERATSEQNRKLDRLIDSIEKLARVKTVIGTVQTPGRLKIAVAVLGGFLGGFIALSCLVLIWLAMNLLTNRKPEVQYDSKAPQTEQYLVPDAAKGSGTVKDSTIVMKK